MKDPYDALGLEPGVSMEDIRAAYRRLAWQWHPDRFTDAPPEHQRIAHRRMQEINRALGVLTDPAERQRFERQRRLRERRDAAKRRQSEPSDDRAEDTTAGAAGRVRFETGPRTSGPSPADDEATASSRAWRAEPRPADLEIREFSGWGDAHWVYVHAPGGRAGAMNVTTGEVTIEREELREDVLRLLQHYAIDSWS